MSGTRARRGSAGGQSGGGGWRLAAGLGLWAWVGAAGAAESIPVPNGSFESPATTYADPRIDGWQKTPKPFWYDESGGYAWSQLTGVFLNTAPGSADHLDNVEGRQAIFLFAVPEVGLFQDYDSFDGTNTVPARAFTARFEPGKAYTLTLGLVGGGGGMTNGVTLSFGLYYRNETGERVTVGAATVTHTAERFPTTTHLSDFELAVPEVKATDPWANRHIGVQVVSTVRPELAGGYWDIDQVRLTATAAVPAPVLSVTPAAAELRLSWSSVGGYTYQAQSSADLRTWTDYGARQAGTGGELSVAAARANGLGVFYRVAVTRGE